MFCYRNSFCNSSFSYSNIIWKLLFAQLRECWRSSKFLLREHVFIWNAECDLLLFLIFRFLSSSISQYLDETVFSRSSGLISPGGDDILLNWFTRCFKCSEGFSDKDLSLSSGFLYLLLLSWKMEAPFFYFWQYWKEKFCCSMRYKTKDH